MATLFDALFKYVDRHREPDGTRRGKRVLDQEHRRRILALLYARRWAKRVGVEFCWVRSDRCSDAGYPYWCCNMYLGGEAAGFCDQWDSGGDWKPRQLCRIWGEGHLALRLMAEFSRPLDDYDVDFLFREGD